MVLLVQLLLEDPEDRVNRSILECRIFRVGRSHLVVPILQLALSEMIRLVILSRLYSKEKVNTIYSCLLHTWLTWLPGETSWTGWSRWSY